MCVSLLQYVVKKEKKTNQICMQVVTKMQTKIVSIRGQ